MKTIFFTVITILSQSGWAAATPWAEIDSSKFSSLPYQVQNIIDDERSYFLLMSFPPKTGLDFRTAEKLKSSLAVAGWGKTNIGHNMIAWSCKGTDGKWHRAATGFTGENSEQSKDLILSGWGITTFVTVFTDGYLTPTSTAAEIIEKKQAKTPMRYFGLEISASQCDAVVGFTKKFAKSKGATQFGLSGDVNKMQGGGCGSFVTAVLEKLNVFNKVTPYYWKKFKLPNRLMGMGDEIPVDTSIPESFLMSDADKKISFNRLINSTWMMTISDVSDYSLTVVDPAMVLYMIKSMDEANYALLDAKYVEKFTKQNTLYVQRLEEDMYSDHPTQKGAVYEKITANFDHRTKAIGPASVNIIKSLHKQGLEPRVSAIGKSLGLIYEK